MRNWPRDGEEGVKCAETAVVYLSFLTFFLFWTVSWLEELDS